MQIRIRIWIQHFFELRIRIPDPDLGSGSRLLWPKIDKKLLLKKNNKFFGSKTTIYLSQGLHKGRPSYRRSLQPSKQNIQYLKTWKFWTFFNFCGSFLPSWIRIRIRNLNADPDPDPATQINADLCGSGSGSETLFSAPTEFICQRSSSELSNIVAGSGLLFSSNRDSLSEIQLWTV